MTGLRQTRFELVLGLEAAGKLGIPVLEKLLALAETRVAGSPAYIRASFGITSDVNRPSERMALPADMVPRNR